MSDIRFSATALELIKLAKLSPAYMSYIEAYYAKTNENQQRLWATIDVTRSGTLSIGIQK
jgi:hypothetical protein